MYVYIHTHTYIIYIYIYNQTQSNFLYFARKNVMVQYFPLLEIKSNVYRNTFRGNK